MLLALVCCISSQCLNHRPPSETPLGVSAQPLVLRLGDNVYTTLVTERCRFAFIDIFFQIILSKET